MMKQKMKKKLTSFASIGLSAAILFISTPITHVAAAEELQSQSVVNQGLQGYLANSQGLLVKQATAEQLQLPFAPNQYYGRSLLSEEGKKAWDYVIKELLAFNPIKNYDNLTKPANGGDGLFTLNLKEEGITVKGEDIKNLTKYLNASDARLFHIRNTTQKYKTDAEGNVETVSFNIAGVYMGDNAYKKTLIGMEKYVSEVLSVVNPRMTESQKVKALYEKYHSTMKYGRGSEIGNAVGALTNQVAICGGYSFGFLYILQRAGLEAIYMTGDTSVGYHAWNYVNVDDQWYMVDSTWGGNNWLLKGQSSLQNHKPRKTQHFDPVPTLAVEDYNLTKAIFKSDQTIAKETIDMSLSVVRDVLNKYTNEFSKIDQVYMFEPTSFEFVGNDVEKAILEDIRQAVKGKFTGSLTIILSNNHYTTVDEFMKDGLYIGCQADNAPYFEYSLGKVSRY